MPAKPSAFRILVGHFLRRFIDNDLISPDWDRHESLATAAGVLLAFSLCVTVLLSADYLAAFIQLPGPTAISALSDRFLFIGISMAVAALATLLIWDGLTLEPRDTANLGILPVPQTTMMWAKLVALLVFAAGLAVAVNIVSIVLYPVFLTLNLHLGAPAVLWLIGVHAIIVITAGAFGFFLVLAIHGLLQVMLGDALFHRVSALAQGLLLVVTLSGLLLLPAVSSTTLRSWLEPGATAADVVPPLWFLGAYETTGGAVVAGAPVRLPAGLKLPVVLRKANDGAVREYRGYVQAFQRLGRRALLALIVIGCLAMGFYFWKSRRLPQAPAPASTGEARRRWLLGIGRQGLAQPPEVQAGFFFTLAVLMRSVPHRLIMAASLALGLTASIVAMRATGVVTAAPGAPIPVGLLAPPVMAIATLLGGFRWAARVPAGTRANWVVKLSWSGDARPYVRGARQAGLLVLAVAPLLVMLPCYAALIGPTRAVGHIACCLAAAVLINEMLFVGCRKMPFVCSYLPLRNPRLFWPIALIGFVISSAGFLLVERRALGTVGGTLALLAILAGLALVIRRVGHARMRGPYPVDFDERPEPATQRLGLHERMLG